MQKPRRSFYSCSYVLLALFVFTGHVIAATGTTGFMGTDPAEDYKVQTIVIDAGHGGHDHGCSGKDSKEKHVALEIALKVGTYIEEHLPDVKVIYTRKTDVFIELHERAAIANRAEADVFISIHCNASTSSQPYGTETYVMGLHRNDANLKVAKRENDVILLEDDYNHHYDGFDPNSPTAHIIFTLHQNAFLVQSIELAKRVEEQFATRVKRHSRGVKQAGFLVLYKTAMPSVLIETGFLSNRKEENYLNSNQGSDYMASAVYRAFRDYKVAMETQTGQVLAEGETMPMQEPAQPEEQPRANDPVEAGLGDVLEQEPIEDELESELPVESSVMEPSPVDLALRTVYRIQVYASYRKYKSSDPVFRAIRDEELFRMHDGTLYKYMVGSFENHDAALAKKAELRKNGFPDAFVVRQPATGLAEK